jgi:hypothetical protein
MVPHLARPHVRLSGAVVAFVVLSATGGLRAQPAARVPAPAVPPAPPPRLFAGYSQPAIPPAACRFVSAGEVDCQMPGMIVGRYVIEAAGASTAQAAGAAQALQIVVGDQVCGVGRDTEPWSSGSRTFRFDCAVTLLSDQPVAVRVLYADEKAVKDPKGPAVKIEALSWNGVLGALPFAPKQ